MSVQSQLNRIRGAKADIINEITAKGVAVPETEKIDALAGYIAQINTGPLWTNPSPGEAFTAQTVALFPGEYGRYLVIAATSAEKTDGAVSIMAATGSGAQLRCVLYSRVGSAVAGAAVTFAEVLREVEYSGGSLVFGDATDGDRVINNYLIPLYVFGVKT